MDLHAVLDQVIDLLRHRRRVTYRLLKRQFDLDDDTGVDLDATKPHLLRLLAVETDDAPATTMPPDVVKHRTFEALRLLALKGAEIRPVVLVIEDLHWSDKTRDEIYTSCT